jgi:hypothetical protein
MPTSAARDDERTAGVVKNRRRDRPHRHGRLREMHSRFAEPVVLGLHVLDTERREGNAILNERFLERLRREVVRP